MTRQELTAGLRELADWFDAHEEVPLPDEYTTTELAFFPEDTKEIAAAVMLALKPCRKDYSETLFMLSRKFGPISTKWYFQRNTVCTRRVVGTEEVAEKHLPARTIPAHTKEVVEWDCEPILSHREEIV